MVKLMGLGLAMFLLGYTAGWLIISIVVLVIEGGEMIKLILIGVGVVIGVGVSRMINSDNDITFGNFLSITVSVYAIMLLLP